MTIKRLKKWKGDSHTHIILKYYSHRRMLDNDGEPAVPNDPRLNTKRKRHYHMKEQELGLAWIRLQTHRRLHPEEPISPVQTTEATPGKPQSKGNQRRREKRARRRAEKRA